MKGDEYTGLIANYLARRFSAQDIEVFTEVSAGKSIIGKSRRVDIMVLAEGKTKALAIECKYQGVSGTADEKIPYALEDVQAMNMPSLLVYAGKGFSAGIAHQLSASPHAAYCLPDKYQAGPGQNTIELDHCVAMRFGWWSYLVHGKSKVMSSDLFQSGGWASD